ncbi:MAG: hypothetical protein JNK85_26815 [Verrucomicrobiales bacterium]|nr:hypothetical protein [Verrucomicrobiales bacterium]
MNPPGKRTSLLQGRSLLQIAIIINQLATPGLGSWMAGRKIAGTGQLALSITGFLLFVVYFVLLMAGMIQSVRTGEEYPWPPAILWRAALLIFGVSWLWAGISSFSLYRQLRRTPSDSPAQPPLLDGR